eukprot:6478842-Prymnesium_polylepis.1
MHRDPHYGRERLRARLKLTPAALHALRNRLMPLAPRTARARAIRITVAVAPARPCGAMTRGAQVTHRAYDVVAMGCRCRRLGLSIT